MAEPSEVLLDEAWHTFDRVAGRPMLSPEDFETLNAKLDVLAMALGMLSEGLLYLRKELVGGR